MGHGKIYYFKLFILFILLWLTLIGVYYFSFKLENQQCTMTYMWELPVFKRHFPVVNDSVQMQRYGLYYYSEGDISLRMKGVPVLFIPGNGGSYKQARSYASVSLRMSLKFGNNEQRFDYFTVDLNEELSAFSTTIIKRQALYVNACLTYIASLYGEYKPIIIIGHSMGGVVARSLMTQSQHRVIMIISLASPLEIPVVSLDPNMAPFYRNLNDLWLKSDHAQNVVLISITGGSRDVFVWDGYGRVTNSRHSLWLPSFSLDNVWSSTDHLSIAWCRELVISLNKAIYKSITSNFTPGQRALFASMQQYLHPQQPLNRSYNISVDHFHKLFFQSQVLYFPRSKQRYQVISLPALASVSRPLRIKVVTDTCHKTSGTKATLFNSDLGHIHQYDIQLESVQLTLTSAPHSFSPVQLQLDLSPDCGHTVTFYVSLVDWIAQLIRVHIGRLPAFTIALIITQYSHTHEHGALSLLALSVTVHLVSYSSLSTDLEWIRLYTMIDIADIVLILCLCLPLAALITTVSSTVTYVFGLLPPLSWSLVTIPLLPVIGLFAITSPPLAFLALLLMHLLSVSRLNAVSLSTKQSTQNLLQLSTVTTVILVLLLLEISPLFAEIHSQLQQNGPMDIVMHGLTRLLRAETYTVPGLHLLIPVTVVTLKSTGARDALTGDNGALLTVMMTHLWLMSVVLGSCCLVYGAVDLSQCGTFLIVTMVLLEACDLMHPRVRSYRL